LYAACIGIEAFKHAKLYQRCSNIASADFIFQDNSTVAKKKHWNARSQDMKYHLQQANGISPSKMLKINACPYDMGAGITSLSIQGCVFQ
jgi:hypothetical protein